MHLLLIHQAFASLHEPGGTRHYEMARYLTRCGDQVTVIASKVSYLTGQAETGAAPDAAGEEQEDGLQILRAYTYSALHKSFFHRLLSFFSFMTSSFLTGLRVKDIDLVWGTSPPIFQGLTAWALARLKGAPFLFEVRDLWPAFAIGVGVLHNPLLIRLSEWLERFLYRHADLVLINSPGFLEHVRVRGAKRIELVPNGADPRMFDPDADGSAFRQAHGFTSKFVALYAGAHGMSNDLGVLLQAAEKLQDRPDIAIVLLGDGKDKPALQQQASRLGLKNVHFLAPVPKSGMAEALAAADVCIAILKPIPLYATVYPNKVFDYMAAGRPVLLAIDGVIRQVVEDAQAGIFASPGDPQAITDGLVWLADHPENAKMMGKCGRKAVEAQFDRTVLAERLAGILASMMARSTSGD